MVLLWGEDGIMIYNDAYSAFAGNRHPSLLGSKVREGWPEVAAFNDHVMRVGLAGGTLVYRDQELTLDRSGHPEQVWMNLDYSPVLGESGEPAGVLCVLAETTARVSAERDRSKGVLDSVAEGFVLLDSDFRVLDINAAGLRMDGRPRETLWDARTGRRSPRASEHQSRQPTVALWPNACQSSWSTLRGPCGRI
jgi:PAS domain-containing protein